MSRGDKVGSSPQATEVFSSALSKSSTAFRSEVEKDQVSTFRSCVDSYAARGTTIGFAFGVAIAGATDVVAAPSVPASGGLMLPVLAIYDGMAVATTTAIGQGMGEEIGRHKCQS